MEARAPGELQLMLTRRSSLFNKRCSQSKGPPVSPRRPKGFRAGPGAGLVGDTVNEGGDEKSPALGAPRRHAQGAATARSRYGTRRTSRPACTPGVEPRPPSGSALVRSNPGKNGSPPPAVRGTLPELGVPQLC